MTSTNFNPNIKTVTVGTREIKDVKIYPLSVADQLHMTDVITEVIQTFILSNVDKKNDVEVVLFIVNAIKENAATILDLVSDSGQLLLSDLSNSQLLEICQIVFEVNYSDVLKNSKDLFKNFQTLMEEPKKESPLKRSSQKLSKKPHTK
jgi:hypothetical protein